MDSESEPHPQARVGAKPATLSSNRS
ncbi:hypothetical protein EE612_039560 [Oryza sativa]|nr:hypothetical protein EE612_039560 [Oryza sativa]